jgi:DNA repair exonuclease SbcCD ATPase subunit
MIQLESIRIRNFRGIRDLELNFDSKNYVIHGPNGSGKSGVVDAIEFALCGAISRLSGPGTAGLEIKRHGPHVDFRDNPREGSVSLSARVKRTGTIVTIDRALDRPRAARITPDDAPTRELFATLARHPEFVLSRREIIKYILVEARTRASEIQSLLKLDRIEDVRTALRTAANTLTRDLRLAEANQKAAREALRRALGIEELSRAAILERANGLRAIAGVAPLPELTATTRLDGGFEDGGGTRTEGVSKRVALADLKALRGLYSGEAHQRMRAVTAEFREKASELRADPTLAQDIERHQLVELGLKYFEGRACPLCDTDWPEADLRALLEGKLARLNRGRVLTAKLVELGSQMTGHTTALERPMLAAASVAKLSGLEAESLELSTAATSLLSLRTELASVVTIARLEPDTTEILTSLSEQLEDALRKFAAVVEALPDGPSPGEARAQLSTQQARLEDVQTADRRLQKAKNTADRSKLLLSTFDATVEGFLNHLYGDIESRFTEHYRLVNSDDEAAFKARLSQQSGSVDLAVDFYGRGLFPPGAYHSEGHQDGMGLCLYLALMQQVQGEGFSFAVLDDVVMSVDARHRRDVCRLLRESFPHTQFIITTHDQVWLNQMRNEGLVVGQSAKVFGRWTVEQGPFVSEAKEAWKEISDALSHDKVPVAAATLRRYLEFLGYELADRFGAEVPLRLDNTYEFGELFPRATKQWKGLITKAISAAQSWEQAETVRALEERKTRFSDAVHISSAEQWAINKGVHYNDWANLSKEDFEPVVAAFRTLVEELRCASCGSFFYPEPRSQPKTLRCSCGQVAFNLVPKGRA